MNQTPSRCSECGELAVMPTRLDVYRVEMEHDGRKYQVEVPELDVLQCSSCHEIAIGHEADIRISEAFHAAIGILPPQSIRAAREALSLKAKDVASGLAISVSTMSRWENGVQLQQRCMDRFLRVYFHFPEVRAYLAWLDKSSSKNPPIPLSDELKPIVPPTATHLICVATPVITWTSVGGSVHFQSSGIPVLEIPRGAWQPLGKDSGAAEKTTSLRMSA